MSDPRYPIGKFAYDSPPTAQQRNKFIDDIEQTPARLRAAIQGLTPQQIETPYREGGWTVRQVVHHVPESHMNAYIRFKLALTEDEPTIKPYMEDRWAQLPDCQSTPLEVSLALLESRSEEHTSELQSPCNLVCRLLLEKKKNIITNEAKAHRVYTHIQHMSHLPSTYQYH